MIRTRIEFKNGAESILFGIHCEIVEEGTDYVIIETERELSEYAEKILDTNEKIICYGFACKTCKEIATEGDYCSEKCFLQAGSDFEQR